MFLCIVRITQESCPILFGYYIENLSMQGRNNFIRPCSWREIIVFKSLCLINRNWTLSIMHCRCVTESMNNFGPQCTCVNRSGNRQTWQWHIMHVIWHEISRSHCIHAQRYLLFGRIFPTHAHLERKEQRVRRPLCWFARYRQVAQGNEKRKRSFSKAGLVLDTSTVNRR